MCDDPEARVGGRVYKTLEYGTCQPILNPAVNFTGYENLPTYIVSIHTAAGNISPIDSYITNGDEFVLLQPLSDSRCSLIPDVVEVTDPPIFGAFPDGTWVQFDPRLKMVAGSKGHSQVKSHRAPMFHEPF